MAIPATRAAINLTLDTTADDLKRIALVFDEILYDLPRLPPAVLQTLQDGDSPKQVILEERRGGYFEEVAELFVLTRDALPSALRDCVDEFIAAGVLKERPAIPTDVREDVKTATEALLGFAIFDGRFNKITNTDRASYRRMLLDATQSVTMSGANGARFSFVSITEPTPLADMRDIARLLSSANYADATPVFLFDRSVRQLSRLYGAYKQSQKERHLPPVAQLPPEFAATLGVVSFNLTQRLFPESLVATKSPAEIIRFRNELGEARQRFVSSHVAELAALLSSEKWGKELRDEVEKYVRGKLRVEVAKYEDALFAAWGAFFAGTASDLVAASKRALIGAAAGTVAGSIFPFAAPWQVAVGAAMLGIASQAPSLVERLLEHIVALRTSSRSGIAYIARFR